MTTLKGRPPLSRPDIFHGQTPEDRYVLGLLRADGSIDCSNGRSAITLALKWEDRDLVDTFLAYCGAADRTVTRKQGVHTSGLLAGTAYDMACASVHSRTLVERLIAMGIGPDKLTSPRPVPAFLAASPDFFRGMVDGDGTIIDHTSCPNSRACGHTLTVSLSGDRYTIGAYREFLAASGLGSPAMTPFPQSPGTYAVSLSGHRGWLLLRLLYRPSVMALARKAEKAAELVAKFRPDFDELALPVPKYVGVRLVKARMDKQLPPYEAYTTGKGSFRHIGYFSSAEEAAAAWSDVTRKPPRLSVSRPAAGKRRQPRQAQL